MRLSSLESGSDLSLFTQDKIHVYNFPRVYYIQFSTLAETPHKCVTNIILYALLG